VMRYRCVTARKAEGFEIVAACDAAGVSRSAYYAWLEQGEGPTEREWDEAHLIDQIRDLHRESDGTSGEPRITAELVRKGWTVNHKRVERLMREEGLQGHRPRRRRSLTKPDEAAPPLPDLLGRAFQPALPDVAWCGDITYVPTDRGGVAVSGHHPRPRLQAAAGWSMGERHDASLVVDALDAAVATRGRHRTKGTIFHHDRGSEYTSAACRAACERLGLTQSAGRTGSCLDNAVAESFFASLKVELVNRYRFATRAQARAAIFAWIVRYNRRRLHSTLGFVPPIEWEEHLGHTRPLPSTMAA
jgi:putative transposase